MDIRCALVVSIAAVTFGGPLIFSGVTAQSSGHDHPMIQRESGLRSGFQTYLDYDEGDYLLKVFVLAPGSAWAYYTRPSYKEAFSGAMNRCTAHTGGRRCRLFAVGNRIVWDLGKSERERAISEYQAGKKNLPADLEGVPITADSLKAFQDYRMVERRYFKVFVLSEDDDAWAYKSAQTYEAAEKAALEACRQYTRRCRVLAAGDTIVWHLNDREHQAVIDKYRSEGPN